MDYDFAVQMQLLDDRIKKARRQMAKFCCSIKPDARDVDRLRSELDDYYKLRKAAHIEALVVKTMAPYRKEKS